MSGECGCRKFADCGADGCPNAEICDDKCSMFNHTEEECEHRNALHKIDAVYCNDCGIYLEEHKVGGIEVDKIIHDDTSQEPSRLEEIRDELDNDPHYDSVSAQLYKKDLYYLLSLVDKYKDALEAISRDPRPVDWKEWGTIAGEQSCIALEALSDD